MRVKKHCRAGHPTDDSVMRRMRIARWIPKPTNTHSEHVIFSAFTRQQCLHEGAQMSRFYGPTLPFSSLNDLRLQTLL